MGTVEAPSYRNRIGYQAMLLGGFSTIATALLVLGNISTKGPILSTVYEAIEHSGVLEIFPEINLEKQKVGIFGKVTKLDAKIEEGARIEIYREITADPELVE